MSDWRDITTAPKDGTFVLLNSDAWSTPVEGFWHETSKAWSPNVHIPDLGNRVIGPQPPTQWKPLTVAQEKY